MSHLAKRPYRCYGRLTAVTDVHVGFLLSFSPVARIGLACNADWVRDALLPHIDVELVKPAPYNIVHKDYHYLIEVSYHHRHHQVAISIHHKSC